MYSFITDGNFIIFKYTEEVPFEYTEENAFYYEHERFKLHNTSTCIDWGLTEDTTRITFTIDEQRYENIPLSSIDFDGDVCDVQQDFIDGVQGMFENLAAGGGEEGGGSLLSTTIELTDAQIKALPTTPIELVAAPGAGKIILPTFFSAVFNLTTAYSNGGGSGSDVDIQLYLDGGNGNGTQVIAFVTSDAPIDLIAQAKLQDGYTILSANENKSLSVVSFNSGDFTGGNAANTLKVTVYYTIVDL